MRVSDLIDKLSEYPEDTLIVIAKDAEGNGFSLFGEAELGVWVGEEREMYFGEDIEEYGVDGVPALCLWP